MDDLQRETIRRANSMKVFAGGDPTFKFGEWCEWFEACMKAGKQLPPEDFKRKP